MGERPGWRSTLLLLGVLIQASFFYFTESAVAYQMKFVLENPNVPNPSFVFVPFYSGSWTDTVLLYIIYFIITIVYSGIIGYFSSPKIIISPLYIQLLTALVSSIILGAYWAFSVFPTVATIPGAMNFFYQNFAIFVALSFMLAFSIGVVQDAITMRVLGLALKSEPDKVSYTVKAPSTEVVKVLKNRDFQRIWSTRLVREAGGTYFMRIHYSTGETTIITVGRDPAFAADTILATVAYATSRYELFKTTAASQQRKSVMFDIEGRLREAISTDINLVPRATDDAVSTRAASIAGHRLNSNLAELGELWSHISRFHKAAGLLIGFGMIVVSVIHAYISSFDLSSFIITEAGLGISLLVDVGLAINQEVRESGAREKES